MTSDGPQQTDAGRWRELGRLSLVALAANAAVVLVAIGFFHARPSLPGASWIEAFLLLGPAPAVGFLMRRYGFGLLPIGVVMTYVFFSDAWLLLLTACGVYRDCL